MTWSSVPCDADIPAGPGPGSGDTSHIHSDNWSAPTTRFGGAPRGKRECLCAHDTSSVPSRCSGWALAYPDNLHMEVLPCMSHVLGNTLSSSLDLCLVVHTRRGVQSMPPATLLTDKSMHFAGRLASPTASMGHGRHASMLHICSCRCDVMQHWQQLCTEHTD